MKHGGSELDRNDFTFYLYSASWVNAPMVRECFMNLACRYVWEKERVPGDDHVMICLEVIGAHMDEAYLADKTGEKGLLYNIHYQLNPERIKKQITIMQV